MLITTAIVNLKSFWKILKKKLVWKKWCNSKLVSIMSIWNKLKLAINQLNFLNLYKLVWTCSSPNKHLSSSFGFVLNLVFLLFRLGVVLRKNSPLFWSARLLILRINSPLHIYSILHVYWYWSCTFINLEKKIPQHGLIWVCTFNVF